METIKPQTIERNETQNNKCTDLNTTHLFACLSDLGIRVPDLVALIQHHIMPVVGEDLILVEDQCGEGSDEDPPVLHNAPNQVLLQHTK